MRKYLITGLIILMPIALTLLIVAFVVDLFTNPFLDIATHYLKNVAILESSGLLTFMARLIILLLFCCAIILLGVVGRHFFFKTFFHWTSLFFSKIPLVKTIFKTSKDIAGSFLTPNNRKAFRRPLLIHFPTKKSHCIGFETGLVPSACRDKIKKPLTALFVPTAPYPISGFMLFTAKENATVVEMTNEEALQLTVSCGMLRAEDVLPK